MAVKETTSVDVKTLTPFKRFIMTLGELPTSYLESMTYAELVMWFCNYLQEKVIPTVNNNAEAVIELQNWFNNLDVQDEIDHKLDEMAESGQLEEIVADYLNSKAIFAYDTVEDLKDATNLIDGSYARTLGYYTINDGGGALYKINENEVENEINIQLDNGLYATFIPSEILNFKQFGAVGDNSTDDSDAIQTAIDYSIYKKLVLDGLNSSYLIAGDTLLGINYGIAITGSITIQNTKFKLKDNVPDLYTCLLINVNSTDVVNLNNIVINGNRENQSSHVTPYQDGGRHGIRFADKGILNLNNILIYDCYSDGLLCIDGTNKVNGKNIEIYGSGRNGITNNAYESYFENLNLHDNGTISNPKSGYHVEADSHSDMNYLTIKNSIIKNNLGDDFKVHFNQYGHHLNNITLEKCELNKLGTSLNVPADNSNPNFIDEFIIDGCLFNNKLEFGPVTDSQYCGVTNLKIKNTTFKSTMEIRNNYSNNLYLENSTFNGAISFYPKFNYLYINNCNFLRPTMPGSDTQVDCGIISTVANSGIHRGIIINSNFNNVSRGIRTLVVDDISIGNCYVNCFNNAMSVTTITNRVTVSSSRFVGYQVIGGTSGKIASLGNDLTGVTGTKYSTGFTVTQSSDITS